MSEFPETEVIPIIVPHSTEAEEALIGCVLIDPVWYEMSGVISDQFYIHRNRWIWDAIGELRKENQAIDFLTICNQLSKNQQLEEIGGAAYLTRLISNVPTTLHAESYAKIIKQDARRRQMLTTANELASAAYHPENQELDEAIEKAVGSLFSNANTIKGAQPFSKHLTMAYEEAEKRQKDPRDVWGMPTGFYDWDMLTGGIHIPESTIISGDPGTGKSMLLLAMVENLAKKGNPGALYVLEMTGMATAIRGVSAESQIPTRRIHTGKMSDEDWSEFCRAIDRLSQLPIYICDETLNITQLRADLYRLKIKYGIKFFGLDYLALLRGYDSLEKFRRLEELSTQIKIICKDLNLAGLVINSMTKEGIKNKVKSMENVGGGSQVIYDADNIVFVTNDEKDDSILVLTFDKLRDVARMKSGKPAVKLLRARTFPQIRNLGTEIMP